MKKLDIKCKKYYYQEEIVLSVKLIKINHVNKKQQRILLLTNINMYNISPNDSFLSNRIKRKISYANITGMTVSRFGS